MFYEYALDPALLTNWKDFRYLVEKFGWEQGRLIARYPRKWKRLVYDLLTNCRELERKRIEERLTQIGDKIIKRNEAIPFDNNKSWLENSLLEHHRKPFRAILSKNFYENHEFILNGEDIDETVELWKAPNEPAPKNAHEITSKLALLLSSSKRILIIDRNFKPNEERFRKVLEFILKLSLDQDQIITELHTSIERFFYHGDEKTKSEEERVYNNLRYELEKHLPLKIPHGKKLTVFLWKKREQGERIHNRYILTDRWGVAFGDSLDESDNIFETDDIHRLSEDIYQERWQQYTSENPAFELVDQPIEIIGKSILKN